MAIAGKHGVTSDTPKNILFGAGTIHKGLTFTTPSYALTSDVAVVPGKTYYTRSGTSPNYTYTVVANPQTASIGTYYEQTGGWNFDATVVGSTSGGSKLSIIPEITNIEVDGVDVKAKGLAVKTGETASMEINFAELTKDIIKAGTLGADGTSEDSANYDLIQSKSNIAVGDFWTNIAFVGKTLDGRKIIAILPNALCTSGFEQEGKNKKGAVGKYTFECHAELSGELDKLPWKIYYPKASV